jgi:tetratricopeptide (TPR) repeat protein
MNVVNALWNLALILIDNGEDEPARQRYEEMVERSRGMRRPDIAFQSVIARCRIGQIHALQGRSTEASNALDEAEQAMASLDPAPRSVASIALAAGRARVLLKDDKAVEALTQLEGVLLAGEVLNHPVVVPEVSYAWLTVIDDLLRRGADDQAEHVAAQALAWAKRIQGDSDLPAAFLCQRAKSLQRLGRREEALELLQEIEQRFGAQPDPAILEVIRRVLSKC